MPEEKFHAQFGRDFCSELIKTPEGKARVQDAIDRYFPYLPRFFGAANSKNNEVFRKYGLKQRKNEEMRADYLNRVKELLDKLGLSMPKLSAAA